MEHSMLPAFPFFDALVTDANNVGTEWLKWVKRHGNARRKLDDYFAPRVNTAFEVYRFRQAKQLENESLDAFYARLRQLVKHCAFVDVDTEIKNQILLSATSTRLCRYAMQHDLDLQGILKQARYKRLNFGINSAAEVFQDTIRQVLANIPNVLNITASRDGVSICRNASFFEDASTVQVKQHQTQTDKPDLDDAAVPSHGAALPDQAIPTPLNTVSQRYPQRTRRRPGHLEDFVSCVHK
ncbi:hypothetical protein MTO96_005685 [Rhipicephalus appendiculatus]